MEQVRQLGEQLGEQQTAERPLRKKLRAAVLKLEQLQHLFGWAE
jgi:hypothetical protein